MALSRIKRWARNEILLSTDLNAEFDNLVNNAQSLVFPLTQDLDVGGYLMNDTGFTAPIQLHENLQSLDGKYANDIGAAIAGIGLSSVTLMIAAPATVSGTYSIPGNIHLWFVGQGNLSINGGSTLTLVAPSQITATSSQSLFSGAGSVLFTQAGVVSPCWWGFLPSATDTANLSAYNACTASLPSAGGVVIVPPGTYSTSGSLTHGNKPVSVVGAHPDLSIIESTATASQEHGLIFRQSCIVKNIQVRTAAALASNYTMKGMALDIPTVSGQTVHWENIKIRDFNIGLYLDGGASYNISQALIKNCDIRVSGPASQYVGSCINTNRMELAEYDLVTCDQNNSGDHAIYNFGCRNVHLGKVKIRNATTAESQAIKLVGDGAGGGGSEVFRVWSVRDADIADCENGILMSLFGTEVLQECLIQNVRFQDVDGTAGVPGAIHVTTAAGTVIHNILVNGFHLSNHTRRLMHVSNLGVINQITVRDGTAYNWGTSSAGIYALVGGDGSGTIYQVHVENVTVDGNSNGRNIIQPNQWGSGMKRLSCRSLGERNTVLASLPAEDSSISATFDFAFGNAWSISGTRTVTAASNAIPGEVYHIVGTNANCTFTDNAVFKLDGNWVSAADKSLTLLCLTTSTFQELGRNAS